jgi:anti-anti-sigma factor
MQLLVEQAGDVVVVGLSGRADSVSAPNLARRLQEAVSGSAGRLVVDLSEVTYISSAGLSVLLAALKSTGETGGALVLCSLAECVREVFVLAGLLPLFTIAETRAAAVIAVRNGCTPGLRDR